MLIMEGLFWSSTSKMPVPDFKETKMASEKKEVPRPAFLLRVEGISWFYRKNQNRKATDTQGPVDYICSGQESRLWD